MNRQVRAAIERYAPEAQTHLQMARKTLRLLAASCRESGVYDLAELCVTDADSLNQQISILHGRGTGGDD